MKAVFLYISGPFSAALCRWTGNQSGLPNASQEVNCCCARIGPGGAINIAILVIAGE
jgi:hypothetical protein